MNVQTMLAAILVEQNKPLVIDKISLPDNLDYGQVLVKVLYSGICGSQLGEINGNKGDDKYLPHLLGHEGTGIVIECGRGVTTVKKDDKVVLHWKKGDGIQSRTPEYFSSTLGKINAGWVTTFNEYAVASENRITKIPDDFDSKSGALLGCAVTTGLGVINNNAKIKIGENVVVWGAGGVGLNIIQGAAMVSAYPIIAVDLYDRKLNLALDIGATHTINSNKANPEYEISKIVGKNGADAVIETTGDVDVIQRAYDVTGQKGRMIMVGVPLHNTKVKLNTLPLHFDKILTGSHGGECRPEIDIPNYIKLCKNNRLAIKHLITDQYDLKDINVPLENMRNGKIFGKCVVKPF